MPPVRQTNFASGELDPKLWGRTDLEVFQRGLRRCSNFFISQQGAAVSRPGTLYVRDTKTADGARLIPFVYSSDYAFVLELGNGYIRFHSPAQATGTVMDPVTPSIPYELASPFTDPDGVSFAQMGAVLVLTHPLENPRELRITTLTPFTATLTEISSYMPPMPHFVDLGNYTTVTYGPVIAGVPAASTSDRPTREWRYKTTALIQEIATGAIFESRTAETNSYYSGGSYTGLSDPPMLAIYPDQPITLYRYDDPAGVPPAGHTAYRVIAYNFYRGRGDLYGFIGQSKSRTFVDDGREPDYAKQPPSGRHPFEVRSATNALVRTEKPITVAFFQERRVFGGTRERPGYLWLSATGDYYNFDWHTLPAKDEALEFDLLTRRREEIRAMVDLGALFIFTDSSVWALDSDGPLTSETAYARVVEAVGASGLQPLAVRQTVLYVRSSGRGVRGISPSPDNARRYDGKDLSTIADHLFTTDGLQSWAYAEDPWGVIWAVRRGDGKLLSFTLGEGVAGWAQHEFDGYVGSVCVVPGSFGDEVYLTVYRTIDGVQRCFVERMTDRSATVPACMDACRLYTGIATTSITGLDHLEGEEVYAQLYGKGIFGPFTVEGGAITLPEATPGGSANYIGLPFVCELESLDVAQTEARLRQKTVVRVGFDVYAASGLQVGPDFDNLTEWRQRTVADSYGAISPATEFVATSISGRWDQSARVALRQSEPLPVTVVGLTRELELGG